MKMNFDKVLGIISILGFIAIIVRASSEYDITPWVEATIFFVMGIALLASGGYKLLFKYFESGLTWNELNKVVTVVVGGLSTVLGVLMLPIFGLELNVFNGVKIIIAFIAIFVIALEMMVGDI